jgi:hypothetical protein
LFSLEASMSSFTHTSQESPAINKEKKARGTLKTPPFKENIFYPGYPSGRNPNPKSIQKKTRETFRRSGRNRVSNT